MLDYFPTNFLFPFMSRFQYVWKELTMMSFLHWYVYNMNCPMGTLGHFFSRFLNKYFLSQSTEKYIKEIFFKLTPQGLHK